MALIKILFIDSTTGFPTEQQPTDTIALGGLTSSGNIVLTSGADLNGLPTVPPTGTSATNRDYVLGLFNGIDWKESSRLATTTTLTGWVAAGSGVGKTLTSPTDSTTHNTVDGVVTVVGNRILVKNGPSNVDNGIYTVTTLADGAGQEAVWTRATDADQNSEVTTGMTTFISEGTLNADSQWTLQTNDTIVVDTTALVFVLTNTSNLVGGDGITITGNTVDVDLATVSGLEFSTGELRIDVATTAELSIDANGLNVEGLPSLFQINAVATSANVTAANLNTLTAGPSSNADGLHTHSTADADTLREDLLVNEAIAVGDPVDWSTTNDRLQQSRASTTARWDVFGVAITAQPTPGSSATIVRRGVATGVLVGASAGDRYYVNNGGGLLLGFAGVSSGNAIIFVGTAKNATDLEVHPQFIGTKA